MTFGEAFDKINSGKDCKLGMRLPLWRDDVAVRVQYPEDNSKMTVPYLYIESYAGKVPWKETMIELFSTKWEVKLFKGE